MNSDANSTVVSNNGIVVIEKDIQYVSLVLCAFDSSPCATTNDLSYHAPSLCCYFRLMEQHFGWGGQFQKIDGSFGMAIFDITITLSQSTRCLVDSWVIEGKAWRPRIIMKSSTTREWCQRRSDFRGFSLATGSSWYYLGPRIARTCPTSPGITCYSILVMFIAFILDV